MEEEKNLHHDEIDPLTQDKFVQHHEFDGIRELANEPPYWLSIIFILTVLFAYAYIARYHIFGAGDLQEAEYNREMAKYAPAEEEEDLSNLLRKETVLEVLLDETSLVSGKEIYKTNCAVCHLDGGQGLVGPNLTDDYWIHGGSFKDIVGIVTEGNPVKGMISWKSQMSKQSILEVSSYITTLVGTKPPNPKAPEGELYEAAE